MKALVTGGGGFLGRAVVEELLAAGHQVSAAGRSSYPELEAQGVTCLAVDLGEAEQVARAVEGHDAVFHVAAKTGVWGPRAEYWRTNVTGTRHVLAACRRHGVTRLVHTSSPSVCFDGRDHRRAGNDLPLAAKFQAAYPETKAIAEREVLAAQGTGGLNVCVLRPHLIVGERDPHLVPRLIERARAGRLRVVGNGRNEVSLTWVENAALAHRLAGEQLAPDAACAGRAYFLAQEEPVLLWTWIAELLERLGEPAPGRAVPRGVARAAGALLELVWKLGRLGGEPPMTRFVAAQLASSHSYDMEPVRRDLGYVERVGLDEATERLVAHFAGTGSPR